MQLQKYIEGKFLLPCVVDFINYEAHAVVDVIQLKDELFKKDYAIEYNGHSLIIQKIIKKYPVQTEANIENRLDILKVRYFCIKTKNHEQATV